MRPLEEVRAELLAAMASLPIETIPITEASGRVLAESPRALTDVPPADTVAMDGYAVRAVDVPAAPRSLRVVGRVAPGEIFSGTLGAGESVRVFTGAPLPSGADSVLMQEDTEADKSSSVVVATCSVKPWENIRFRGEDIAIQSNLLHPGIRLGPAQLGLLAAAGIGSVAVHQRPRVGILVTGSELVPPGNRLKPGQIYESNGIMLATLLRSTSAEVINFPMVLDQPECLEASLRDVWPRVDLLVTSGGASVGEPDLVRDCIAHLGGIVHDGEVAMKPGKPFFWAKWHTQFLAGLPGNPVSAFVTAVLLVLPAIRRLEGLAFVDPPTTNGLLGETLSNGAARRHFVRVATDDTAHVRPSGVQASHRLASLAAADGLVEVSSRSTLSAGTQVKVIRW